MDDRDKEIKKLREEVEHLKKLAFKDDLTGLYNRRALEDISGRFVSEIEWERGNDGEHRKSISIKSFSIVLFDIDDFKKVNDTYGHQVGDKVLEYLGSVLQENVRDMDIAARWGGEEMVLSLVGANEEDAYKIANRIREQVENYSLESDGKEVQFTVSGGVSSFKKSESFEDMFKNADDALYEAKNSGKNQIIKASDL